MNNNFNNSFNNQPTSGKPLKNKFFNQDIMDDASVEDVGSSTSFEVNNHSFSSSGNFGNVSDFSNFGTIEPDLDVVDGRSKIANGVNSVVFNVNQPEVLDDFNNNESLGEDIQDIRDFKSTSIELPKEKEEVLDEMPDSLDMPQVIFNESADEVLDESVLQLNNDLIIGSQQEQFDYNQNMNNQMSMMQQPMQQPMMEQMNQNMMNQQPLFVQQNYDNGQELLEQPMNYNQVMFNTQNQPIQSIVENNTNNSFKVQSSGQDVGMLKYQEEIVQNPSDVIIMDDNLASQQPLSFASMGVESPEKAQQYVEVVNNSKFFPNTSNALNSSSMPIQQGNINTVQTSTDMQQQMALTSSINPIDTLYEPPKNVIDNVALLKAYVGPKFQKINMSPFNFCAFLFGAFYLYYRKLYLIGVLVSIINIVALIFLITKPLIMLCVTFGISILLGLFTNNIYIKIATKRVNKIMKKYTRARQVELNKICQSSGGTSFILAFLFNIIINTIVSGAMVFIVGPSYFNELYNDLLNGNKKIGVLTSDKSVNVNDIITYQLPDGFIKKDDSNNSFIFTTLGTDNGKVHNTCSLSIDAIAGFDNSKDLIEHMAEKENVSDKIEQHKSSKGLEWYTYQVEDNLGKYIYRSTTINDKVILLQYTIGVDTPEGVCDTHFVNILDSIDKK